MRPRQMKRRPVRPQPTPLLEWQTNIERLLDEGAAAQALPLIQVVLVHRPRHLITYVNLLRGLWMMGKWGAAEQWGRRILRADPMQEMGWAVMARAVEGQAKPQKAHQYWLMALEQDPYNQQIRAGVLRTALGRPEPLGLNESALATLHRINGAWSQAATLYRRLLAQTPNRIDWQCGLLESIWLSGERETALDLARYLVQREPNCYIAWVVSMQLGDANDRALAQQPLAALDPDGFYAARRYRLTLPQQPTVTIDTSEGEASLLAQIA